VSNLSEDPLHAQADAARLRSMLESVTQHLEDATNLIEKGDADEDDVMAERELIAEAKALLKETK